MSEAQSPVFVLIHGFCHGSWCWQPLVSELKQAIPGCEIVALDLPNRVAIDDHETPPQELGADVGAAVPELNKLLDQGRDVIVVAHSYGGVVAGEAVGKVLDERSQKPNASPAQVRWMVYLAAYPVAQGVANFQCGDGIPEAEPTKALPMFDIKDEYLYPNNLTADALFGNAPAPKKAEWASKFTKGSLRNALTPTTAKPGWLSVPSTFVYTKQDVIFPYDFQVPLLKRAQGSAKASDGDVVPFSDSMLGQFLIDGPHSAQLTHVSELKDVLVQIYRRVHSP